MWNNLKSTDLINDSMYYGETICQLSRIVHQSPSLNVTETIFLSSKYFSEYLVNRNIRILMHSNNILSEIKSIKTIKATCATYFCNN